MRTYLTKAEIGRLIDSVKGTRDKLMLRMGLALGCRVSEIADIELRTIQPDRLTIHDLKKKTYREVVIDSETKRLLDQYLKTSWTPRHRKGQKSDRHERLFYMSPKSINRLVKIWFEKARIPDEKAHWHVLRHTFVYQSMEAGVPISHLCAQTGDSVAVLVRDYGTPTIDSRNEVMEKRGRYWEPGVKD